MSRIASLDLLRGLAAFAVVIPHFLMLNSTPSDVPEIVSILAVEVFFVLSGFVLGPQIFRCFQSGRPGDLSVFLVRRWMRTIPPYLVALCAISILTGHFFTADFFRYAFYVENLFRQHNSSDYFPVAWSLSVEEWFYICLPSLFLAMRAVAVKADLRRALAATLCFIVAISMSRALFGDADNWGAGVRRVVLFRIDSIAYGFVLYLAVLSAQSRNLFRKFRRQVLSLAAMLAFAMSTVVASVLVWHMTKGESRFLEQAFPFVSAMFGLSAVLLAYVVGRDLPQGPFAEFCYFLGRISYSLYLFHLMVALAIGPALLNITVPLQLLIYVAVCMAVCSAFYYWFERPILAARPEYAHRLGRSGLGANSTQLETAPS
jgi:peptidoglycan/LPS O-acetylase OafA/YrhL